MKNRDIAIIILVAWLLPALMGAWIKTKPAGSDAIQDSDDLIRDNNAAIETAVDQDHDFTTSGTQTGKHEKLTFKEQSGDQTTAANEMAIYTKDLGAAPGLYIRPQSNGTVVQWSDESAKIVNAAMAADAIDSDQYVDGSIDLAHMSANSIDSNQYVVGSIDANHLAADVIDETKIADDGIDSEHYNDGSIDTEHFAGTNNAVAKSWVCFDGDTSDTATIKDSYNVTSVTRDAEGKYTITWDTDFANVNYAVIATAINPTASHGNIAWVNSQTVGTCTIWMHDQGGTITDSQWCSVIAFGDQ